MADDEKKSDHINVRVVTQGHEEVFFKIRRTTALSKLMKAFCQRQGVSLGTYRFFFDGERIQPDNTPEDLDIGDNEIIDAMQEQSGGF